MSLVKNFILATTAIIASVSVYAKAPLLSLAPQTEPVTASVAYRNDKAIEREGVEVSSSYRIDKALVVGANVFADDEDVIAYGVNVGVPVKVWRSNIVVTPFIGYERYHEAEANNLNAGAKLFVPVVSPKTGLTADVKYIEPVGANKDKVKEEEVSFSVGLQTRF